MDHANQPGLSRTDVSGSEFEVGAPTSEEEAERKKSQTKRAPKSPLTAVLESWLLSILHCRFLSYQWLIPCLILGDAETIPGVSGNEDVSTGVATDGQLRGRHIVVTRSLVPLSGGPQHDVPEAVHNKGWSRELLEQAFDDGNTCVQTRKLLVLFPVDSVKTSDTSGDDIDTSKWRQKILSKKTFRMKKMYAATELGRFFMTGSSDAAKMPNHFYCRVCPKNVSVLTHGHHELLRHFQGSRHIARDQRLRLESPGWRVPHFHGNPLGEDELGVKGRRSRGVLLWCVTLSIRLRRT